jgi:NADH-quinone oxidoreductase subunit J
MTRPVLALLAIGLVLGLGLIAPPVASAQPAAVPVPTAPNAAPGHVVAAHSAPAASGTRTAVACTDSISPHGDIVQSSGNGMAVTFWLFAFVMVGGSLFVITRRNLIAAVMGMVGSFGGIAAVYMMLYANFLAVLQMLVYAGAIMVLFVFVIMILNRPEDEPIAPTGRAGLAVGTLATVYLVGRLAMLLWHVVPPNKAVAMCAPSATPQGYEWGSVRAVGTDLFGPGLFPFEAISILLLVAVVGAIAIARPLHEDRHPGDDADADPGADQPTGGHA